MQPRRVLPPLLGLYVLAALARFSWIWFSGLPEPANDALEYLQLARNIASGRGFSLDGVTPYLYRPPLFAGSLGLWFLITGTSSQASAAAFQILVNASIAPLTAALCESLGLPRSRARLSGAIMALYPYGFINIGIPLQEFLMAPFVTATIWLISRQFASPSLMRAGIAGLGMGMLVLLKAPHMVLPWFLAGVMVIAGPTERARSQRFVILMLVLAHLAVVPWTIRNYLVSGGKVILVNSQETGVWLWAACDGDCGGLRDSLNDPIPASSAPKTQGFFDRGDRGAADFIAARNEEALRDGQSGSELAATRRAAAREYLVMNPTRYLKNLGRCVMLTLAPAARPGLALAAYPLRMLVMAVFHIPLFLGLFLGIRRGWKERHLLLLTVCAYVGCYAAIHMVTLTGEGRQMIPFLPFLTVLLFTEFRSHRKSL